MRHPLGNFTVNHFARVNPSAHAVDVHWVLDMAEIPAFTEIRSMDTDHDGSTGPDEQAAWLDARVPQYVAGLALTVDGQTGRTVARRRPTAQPSRPGRAACRHSAWSSTSPSPRPLPEAGVPIQFEDTTFAEHIGWREIVVQAGAGVRINAVGCRLHQRDR